MKRTQIYLDEQLFELLRLEGTLKGKTVSKIIRDTLNKKFLKREKKINMVDKIAGLWADRDFRVDAYIRNLRNEDKINRKKQFI